MRKQLVIAFLSVTAILLSGSLTLDLLLPRHASASFRVLGQVSLMLVVGLSAAVILSRALSRDIRRLAAAAVQLRNGNLRCRVDVRSRHEVGELASAFNALADRLRTALHEMQATAEQVAEAASILSSGSRELDRATGEVARSSREIAKGAERQVGSVHRTGTIAKTLASSIEEISRQVDAASRAARTMRKRAASGMEAAGHASAQLHDVAESVEGSRAHVASFRETTSEIHKVVDFILSIAQQTQILALNASIEAAKAGDEGRGFAALAEEIRGLADRTGAFGGQIQAAARSIEQSAGDVVRSMENTARVARDGEDGSDRIRRTLEELGTAFESVADTVERITTITREQQDGARGVVEAMAEIADIARQTARGTDETSAAVAEQHVSAGEMARSAQVLAATASGLMERAGRFRLADAEADDDGPRPAPVSVDSRLEA